MAPMDLNELSDGEEPHGTYLVILKVHGSNIRLFEAGASLQQQQHHQLLPRAFRILCHDLENRKDVQVFVLDAGPATGAGAGPNSASCGPASGAPERTVAPNRSLFQGQQLQGQEVAPTDLAIFMAAPIEAGRKAAYAIEVGVGRPGGSLEDLSGAGGSRGAECKKLGAAYVYLEPRFSTQGVQQMQIMSAHTKAPIGQMQVEYLIVTNPAAFGKRAPMPSWLSSVAQLDAGHRGAGSGCRADLQGRPITENTVASFNYAARHGADMCELDVMCTADGVPVVYHNYTLSNSGAGSGVNRKPVQIDELTLEELRRLRAQSMLHDENCKHNRALPTQQQQQQSHAHQHAGPLEEASQPFPTLEEVLRDVDKSCALNIELKWAQLLPDGRNEAAQYREINDFVDRILACIRAHSNGRRILLSTLNADIAIMLRLKQTTYPVLFLTTGDSQRFSDPATKTIRNAIHLAQAFDMAGINPNAKMLNECLVRYAKERNLLIYAWGDIKSAQAVRDLRRFGLDGVIYDKIDLIKPQD